MARRGRTPAPDQGQRDAAVTERARNVLLDAGAGTGKTTILVDRLVEKVAPRGGGPAIPIARIAAITYTRKAAGELRLRIRERLLGELAAEPPESLRAERLRDALAGLDTAFVGTVHGFADRLLRLRPVEAGLSPSYDIVEDEGALLDETFDVLLHAAQNGTLAEELHGTDAAARAEEATRTILDALGAGLRARSLETEWRVVHGLDALVAGFLRQRDVPPPDAPSVSFDSDAFRTAADAMVRLCDGLPDLDAPGLRWLHRAARALRRLRDERDPVLLFSEIRRLVAAQPRDTTKSRAFAGHDRAYDVWKAWEGDTRKRRLRDGALRDELRAPLDRWMATRLVRLFPVVTGLYERVKARRRKLDTLDLLEKLRDLVAHDLGARGDFQKMFDHVFVDEFQDTDPLQAEIVLYLCEREPRARRWEDVELADGKLTLVGDPKQSIYRFRRADVAMYDRVRGVVARSGPLEARLTTNFRSVPPLIAWLNDRFARVLGTSPDGRPFDPETGRVFQEPLDPGRQVESPAGERVAATPPVHVLELDGDGGRRSADEYRELEGRALARYLRWLVESSDVRIVDSLDGRARCVRYGDVAVLAVSTWRLPLLFAGFDKEGIPYASRGGTLFLQDPLQRQFLLGLRAIADRDDGVAEAALLRPPFFAVELSDLVRERASARDGDGSEATGEEALRVGEARELVRELRRRRFDRPPGSTARDLLEKTAFGRAVALGPNGTQRLLRLRELCLVLEQLAAEEGLDYDAATARLREWVHKPVPLDPPQPVGTEAVQVLTVHQAKGLEFPVVAIWDGRGRWDQGPETEAWRMDRDGRGWMIALDGLVWEEPAGLGIREKERRYLEAERRRIVYVAATRARDLLIVPKAGAVQAGRYICGDLLEGAPPELVFTVERYVEGAEPAWARRAAPTEGRPADGEVRQVREGEGDRAAGDGDGREGKGAAGDGDGQEGEGAAGDGDGQEGEGAAGDGDGQEGEGAAGAAGKADRLDREVDGWWAAVSAEAARPRFRPSRGSGEAHADPRADDAEALARAAPRQAREGRFGALFGTTVHRAIGFVLGGESPTEAIERAVRETGLVEHLEEARADVERAIKALAAEGHARRPGSDLRLEYPVAGAWEGGQLVSGYIDLVAVTREGGLDVIDFKTDAPPDGDVERAYPHYVAQVRAYGRLLEAAGLVGGRPLRCGLLFSADGRIRWVEARAADQGGPDPPARAEFGSG